MRITLIADGSLGDVYPYLALAKALSGHGHAVRFATSSAYESAAIGAGAEFFPLGTNDPKMVWSDHAAARPTRNPVRFIRHLIRSRGGADQGLSRMAAACQGAQAVVATTATMPSAHVAVRDRVPVVGCHLSPLAATTEFPRPIGPPWAHRLRLGPAWNWFTHQATDQMFWEANRPTINRWRVTELRLPPLGRLSGPRWIRRTGVPLLFGFSPTVIPRPHDWPTNYHVTGYWFGPESADWQPPEPLVSFLRASGPVVFVGFGSQVVPPAFLREVLVRGILQAGARAVVVGAGWSEWGAIAGNDRVHLVQYVPYRWLFPRVSAVIHHCGAGTAAEALRAGVRSVLVPFTGEQRFWAERICDVGITPPPLDPRRLTADRLAYVLRQALRSTTWAARAKCLGQQVRAEDGVGTAVRLIEQYATGKSKEIGDFATPNISLK